jgi:hypothetical protein
LVFFVILIQNIVQGTDSVTVILILSSRELDVTRVLVAAVTVSMPLVLVLPMTTHVNLLRGKIQICRVVEVPDDPGVNISLLPK